MILISRLAPIKVVLTKFPRSFHMLLTFPVCAMRSRKMTLAGRWHAGNPPNGQVYLGENDIRLCSPEQAAPRCDHSESDPAAKESS